MPRHDFGRCEAVKRERTCEDRVPRGPTLARFRLWLSGTTIERRLPFPILTPGRQTFSFRSGLLGTISRYADFRLDEQASVTVFKPTSETCRRMARSRRFDRSRRLWRIDNSASARSQISMAFEAVVSIAKFTASVRSGKRLLSNRFADTRDFCLLRDRL